MTGTRKILVIIAIVLAMFTGGTLAATAANASVSHNVDASLACSEAGVPGVGLQYQWGILCVDYGFPWSFNVKGSANPWSYCWNHYRQGAHWYVNYWNNHWVCW
jgi:hypothetical protein